MASQMVVFVPARYYLLSCRQRRVDEYEWRILFEKCTPVKAVERRPKYLYRIRFAGRKQIRQTQTPGAKPGNTVHVVLNQEAAHVK